MHTYQNCYFNLQQNKQVFENIPISNYLFLCVYQNINIIIILCIYLTTISKTTQHITATTTKQIQPVSRHYETDIVRMATES